MSEQDKSAISSKFGLIILSIILIGYITGFIYGLLYTVPHFVLFFVLTILLSNFIPFSPMVMTFAIIIGFLLIAWYTVRVQLDISEEDEDRKDPKEYQISQRNFNIIKSQQEPIVCQNCRSFIPASSKRCPVCLETITDNS